MTESDARRPPCSNINNTVISLRFNKLDPKGGVHDINVTNIAIDIRTPQILVQLSCLDVIAI